jgi:homoserine kinase
MAFQLYTTIKLTKANRTSIDLIGENLEGIAADKSNLVYKVAALLFQRAGMEVPELEIEIQSDIPLTRGLGSSASAIIGSLVASNSLAGTPFDREEIYKIATELEGHPDNVGASLFGGIVIAAWDSDKVSYIRVQPPRLKAVVAIPNFELSTKEAREVLPTSYSSKDAVKAISHSALLAASLVSGDVSVLSKAMEDVIHQPYRMHLIPGMKELLSNSKHFGALGIALSGAGPTIIGFTENDEERLKNYMVDVFLKNEVPVTIRTLLPDHDGVCIL